MRRMLLPLVAAVLATTACSQKAQNDTAEAAETAAADAGATMNHAVETIDAASDRAFGAAGNSMDVAGNSAARVGNSIDSAGDAAGKVLKDAGNEIAD